VDAEPERDPAPLTRHLARRAERPGLVDQAAVRATVARHTRMATALPLAEVVARHVGSVSDDPAVPIVYARPAPDVDGGSGGDLSRRAGLAGPAPAGDVPPADLPVARAAAAPLAGRPGPSSAPPATARSAAPAGGPMAAPGAGMMAGPPSGPDARPGGPEPLPDAPAPIRSAAAPGMVQRLVATPAPAGSITGAPGVPAAPAPGPWPVAPAPGPVIPGLAEPDLGGDAPGGPLPVTRATGLTGRPARPASGAPVAYARSPGSRPPGPLVFLDPAVATARPEPGASPFPHRPAPAPPEIRPFPQAGQPWPAETAGRPNRLEPAPRDRTADIAHIVDLVHDRFVRRLAVEAERRAVR